MLVYVVWVLLVSLSQNYSEKYILSAAGLFFYTTFKMAFAQKW